MGLLSDLFAAICLCGSGQEEPSSPLQPERTTRTHTYPPPLPPRRQEVLQPPPVYSRIQPRPYQRYRPPSRTPPPLPPRRTRHGYGLHHHSAGQGPEGNTPPQSHEPNPAQSTSSPPSYPPPGSNRPEKPLPPPPDCTSHVYPPSAVSYTPLLPWTPPTLPERALNHAHVPQRHGHDTGQSLCFTPLQDHEPCPRPSLPPSRPLSPGRLANAHQVNQQNDHYVSLRSRAMHARGEKVRYSKEARQARMRGDKIRAKELSNAQKAHQAKMKKLNDQAAEWIFKENNLGRQQGEIDLHGLYVSEAIRYATMSIQVAQARGDPQLRLIVGKGLHSADGVAKLRPAIEKLIQQRGLVAKLDSRNAGVLVVELYG